MLSSVSLLAQTELLQAIVLDPLVMNPERMTIEAIELMQAQWSAPLDLSEGERVAHLKARTRSSGIAIVENDRLVGLVAADDIVRACAERRDLERTPIREIMDAKPWKLRVAELTDLAAAIESLVGGASRTENRYQTQYLAIVDDRDRLVGLTSGELLQSQAIESLSSQLAQQTERLQEQIAIQLADRDASWMADRTLRHQAECEFVLQEITQRMRKSLELSLVFDIAVREIRAFLETDRVAIFKFSHDLNFDEGKFIAESVAVGLEPLLGYTVRDPDFDRTLADYYRQGHTNSIANIRMAGLLADEVAILAKFQVRANLVVPLLDGYKLWGFICIHNCADTRSWQESEINFVERVAEQIGMGIQQSTLYAKVQAELDCRWQAEREIARQLKQQQALAQITQQIRNSLQIETILRTATERVRELMDVDRVAIFRLSPDRHVRAVEEIVVPEYPSLLERDWHDERVGLPEFEFYLQSGANIVDDVRQDKWSANLQAYIEEIGVKSKIVVPILLTRSDDLAIDDLVTADNELQLWGLLSVHACKAPRVWQEGEAKLLQQIADCIAISIHQASLFEQLQTELAERQQAELQLRQSNSELARATRLKDEFLANMSHELRTPLNAILGLSEGLQTSALGSLSDRQRRALNTIESSGRHLLALINDILDLSKIATDQIQLELTAVSIESLCQNSTLSIAELAHKGQIDVRTQIAPDLARRSLRVDDLRFRQILINLLSNAIKFTPAGGSVTLDVRLAGDGDSIAFAVTDTGIGIAPANLDKLFQSFVQIDSGYNRQYGGTGLGLALVKQLVELHGGSVAVQSEIDRGSCFTVLLPFAPILQRRGFANELMATPTPSPVATEIAPAQATTVLIVEDNAADLETMVGYLHMHGYNLLEARSGFQAIEMLASHHPDIILMDMHMPGMDGFESIGRIRQLPDFTKIPIVALTALAMPLVGAASLTENRQKCLDAGADIYVTKPVKLSHLVESIDLLTSDRSAFIPIL